MSRYKTSGTRKRKRAKGAPTHIGTVALDASPREMSIALLRRRAGLRLYDAVLDEAKKRSRAVKADPNWERATKMPKGVPRSKKAVARNAAFREVQEAHGFTEEAILSFASSLRKSWVREQVFSQEAQALGARAFSATWGWHMGKRGEPKRRELRDPLHSLSCKDLKGSMRPVVEEGKITHLQWGKDLQIPVSTPKTRREEVERNRIESLVEQGKLLYCRVIFEEVSGRTPLYAQLVLDGPAPIRHPVGKGKVSFDMGPSWVHVVPEHAPAFHAPLAPSVTDPAAELRRLQRHLERQHRAASPECFDASGRHIHGRCHWKSRSKAAQRTQAQITEVHRCLSRGRDRDHGNLVNRLYALGNQLSCEDLDYVSWQKKWPKSTKDRAPGAFVERARRRGRGVGHPLYEYDPRLALSQTCIGGERKKKPLSERRHVCENHDLDCDRDLFSAYLGLYVERKDDKDTLDLVGAAHGLESREAAFGPPGQDLGQGPEKTPVACGEKPRVRRRHPAGRRSLVRIRRRMEAKPRRRDRAARPEDGNTTPVPTAKEAA